jgi:hypothetical protein
MKITLQFLCGLALLLQSAYLFAQAPPSDTSRVKLHALIDSVQLADYYSYDTKDNLNQSMDCAKIISNPNGGFIAVYHHYVNSEPNVFLATSADFTSWTIQATIATNASQPTIAEASDGGYIMAWEQEPNNHLKFAKFNDISTLLAGTSALTYDAPRTLSTCAEGTPNIYEASTSLIRVGLHYYQNCNYDRQAYGELVNFNSWSASPVDTFDNALLYWGVQGNIGDRDAAVFDGYDFGLIEGQFVNQDFGSWRSFIYDYQTGNAEQLQIVTHGGSTAFANPTFTFLEIDGLDAVVVTLFVPSEGAANGEAGELIYYRFLEDPVVTDVYMNSQVQPRVYPNPTAEVLWVELTPEQVGHTYSIFDLEGKTVSSGRFSSQRSRLSIDGLSNGIYLLEMEDRSITKFSVNRD